MAVWGEFVCWGETWNLGRFSNEGKTYEKGCPDDFWSPHNRVKRSLFELTSLPLDLGVLLTSEISVGVWLSALNPPV